MSNKYDITDRITGERKTGVEADSAQEACDKCGWMISYCHVQEVQDPKQSRECEGCRYNRAGCTLHSGQCINDPDRPEWEPAESKEEVPS